MKRLALLVLLLASSSASAQQTVSLDYYQERVAACDLQAARLTFSNQKLMADLKAAQDELSALKKAKP